jgi:hypothetical protein
MGLCVSVNINPMVEFKYFELSSSPTVSSLCCVYAGMIVINLI